MIVAECERCGGRWRVPATENVDPEMLEGVCKDCQAESDLVERPLTFRYGGVSDRDIEWGVDAILPKDWLL